MNTEGYVYLKLYIHLIEQRKKKLPNLPDILVLQLCTFFLLLNSNKITLLNSLIVLLNI